MKARCPACGAWTHVDDEASLGDQFECLECGELLEIVSLNPFKLAPSFASYEEEEDSEDW